MLKKFRAPLFEPNTLSEKRLFRMAATKQYDHLTYQWANICQETASNFVLKYTTPNVWLNYMQESVKKFAPFFSDLVLNAQFLEQINDRYSKN